MSVVWTSPTLGLFNLHTSACFLWLSHICSPICHPSSLLLTITALSFPSILLLLLWNRFHCLDIMWQSKRLLSTKAKTYYNKAQLETSTAAECQSEGKNNPSIPRRCSESVLAQKLCHVAAASSTGNTAARFSHCSDEPSCLRSSGVKPRALSSSTHAKDRTVLIWSYCRVPGCVLTPRARSRALSTALWVRGGPTDESLLTGGTVAK